MGLVAELKPGAHPGGEIISRGVKGIFGNRDVRTEGVPGPD